MRQPAFRRYLQSVLACKVCQLGQRCNRKQIQWHRWRRVWNDLSCLHLPRIILFRAGNRRLRLSYWYAVDPELPFAKWNGDRNTANCMLSFWIAPRHFSYFPDRHRNGPCNMKASIAPDRLPDRSIPYLPVARRPLRYFRALRVLSRNRSGFREKGLSVLRLRRWHTSVNRLSEVFFLRN